MLKSMFNAIRNYCITTSFHGLRFIAEEERHWTERLLWLALCLLSWFGSALLILGSWEAFQNNAVSFVVDTSYLNKNTSFPTISVCEHDNLQKIYDTAQEIWGNKHDNNLDEILKELTYYRGEAFFTQEFCSSGDLECPDGNYYDLITKARSSCAELISSCYWRGNEIDCCKHFVKIDTELGPCFMFTNKHEMKLKENGDTDYIETESNREIGLASVTLYITAPSLIYLHSESERPYVNTLSTDIIKIFQAPRDYRYGIVTTDMENPPEVRDLSIYQRKCRFPDENYLESSDEYAYSSCEVDCRKQEQLRLCNCTSHLMPNTPESMKCDLKGILCLNSNVNKFNGQKTKWSDKEGLICDCLPGCNEAQYNIVTSSVTQSTNNYSTIELFLDRFPSERYLRNVIRTRLDLVVSMGGAAGLFVGASLLSFVEIFYIFIFRSPKSDNNNKKEKEKKVSSSEEYTINSTDIIKPKNPSFYRRNILITPQSSSSSEYFYI